MILNGQNSSNGENESKVNNKNNPNLECVIEIAPTLWQTVTPFPDHGHFNDLDEEFT